jgi:hypothetical protein
MQDRGGCTLVGIGLAVFVSRTGVNLRFGDHLHRAAPRQYNWLHIIHFIVGQEFIAVARHFQQIDTGNLVALILAEYCAGLRIGGQLAHTQLIRVVPGAVEFEACVARTL